MIGWSRRWFGGAIVCIGSLCGCPLPDFGIEVITEDVNNGAVKLIEPVGLSNAARCDCELEFKGDLEGVGGCDPDEPPEPFEADCPQSDVIGLPPFLDPHDPQYQFCRCPQGFQDTGALYPIEFFAEDQDELPDANQPKDKLLAAILLNADPEKNPSDAVAYGARYRNPSDPLPVVAGGGYEPPGRPMPWVRRIVVGDGTSWDLCSGDTSVELGFNTFTVLVTDRPWNEVTVPADPEAKTEETTIPQIGVVDIAAGATFDTQSYTFYCSSTDDPTNPVSPGGEGNDPFGCADRCVEPGG